ncbi:MAG: hypothetical protein RL364_108 [Pseudomonadota bacterium]|jgi:intracellular sulfur oxidation DsrE/DsrF family protein
MKKLLVLSAGVLACTLSFAQVKVAYHLTDGVAQAAKAMNNIRNHLAADPTAKIVVVSHGSGIDFMLEGAQKPNGAPFNGDIGDLASKGVEFRVCNNTLVSRKITKDKLAMEAVVVPSGVAEVAKLQANEHFVYLKP